MLHGTRRSAKEICRREFLKKTLVATAAGSSLFSLPARARAQKTGTIRVWTEPGPQAAVIGDALNEWAQKKQPGLKFQIEIIPWGDIFPKLISDIAAGRPAGMIHAGTWFPSWLGSEGILVEVTDVVDKIGRDRFVPGALAWGQWKGKQYGVPLHHQADCMVSRMDVIKDLGLPAPDTWTWKSFLDVAKTIKSKTKLYGMAVSLGKDACGDIHVVQYIHQAGGKMFDAKDNFRVVLDSPAAVEAFEYLVELYQYMPPGATGYGCLDVVDAMVTGISANVWYWGRVFARAAEQAPKIYDAMEAWLPPAHPKTGFRWVDNDLECFMITKQNPFVAECKEALSYFLSSRDWYIRYMHGIIPNVSPIFKDVIADQRLYQHPFFMTKKRSIMLYYEGVLPHTTNPANELVQGMNPLSALVMGKALPTKAIQKVLIEKQSPKDAIKWFHAQLEAIRKENLRMISG